MAKKCIVIGASGFIGVYVVDALLQAGYQVVCAGRNHKFDNYFKKLGCDYIDFDLDDPTSAEKLPNDPDFIVHLSARLPASSTFNLKTEDDAASYIRTNTLATAFLLEWARKRGINRIISTTTYADVQESWSATSPVKENWPRNFKMNGDHAAYVISKNASADLLFYYNSQYGMKNCVFRLPPVYGCGPHGTLRENGVVRKSGIGLFVDRAKAGLPITVFGNAKEATRDIVYVKDVADALVLAGASEIATGLYNIGAGQTVSLFEQAKVIAEVFAGPNGVSEVTVDESRGNGIQPYSFDISRAKTDFSYNPKFATFKAQMLDWKREEERGVMPALFAETEQLK